MVELKDREREESQTTYAPAIAALGLLLGAVLLTVHPPSALLGLLLLVVSLGLWVRESVRQNRGLVPPEEMRAADARGLGAVSLYGWAGAGFGLVQLVFAAAALRVAAAHGLLDPALPDLPVRPALGHAATVAVLAGAAGGAWAARAAGGAARGRVAVALGLQLVAHLALLGLVLAQLAAYAEGPIFPDSVARTSAAWLVVGILVPFALSAAVASGVLLGRVLRGHAGPERLGPVFGVAVYGWATALLWLLVYGAFWLRLLRVGSHII